MGLLGMAVPEAYGGSGMDTLSMVLAIEALGWADAGTALTVAAHNGLGCAPLVLFGTEEQKQRFLPGVATGEKGLAAPASSCCNIFSKAGWMYTSLRGAITVRRAGIPSSKAGERSSRR